MSLREEPAAHAERSQRIYGAVGLEELRDGVGGLLRVLLKEQLPRELVSTHQLRQFGLAAIARVLRQTQPLGLLLQDAEAQHQQVVGLGGVALQIQSAHAQTRRVAQHHGEGQLLVVRVLAVAQRLGAHAAQLRGVLLGGRLHRQDVQLSEAAAALEAQVEQAAAGIGVAGLVVLGHHVYCGLLVLVVAQHEVVAAAAHCSQ